MYCNASAALTSMWLSLGRSDALVVVFGVTLVCGFSNVKAVDGERELLVGKYEYNVDYRPKLPKGEKLTHDITYNRNYILNLRKFDGDPWTSVTELPRTDTDGLIQDMRAEHRAWSAWGAALGAQRLERSSWSTAREA